MCGSATEQVAAVTRTLETTVVRPEQPGAASSRHHRERQIAKVLVRYGLSHAADVLGLERLVSASENLIGREPTESRSQPENFRLALQELGATFIKLGQLLSTRTDLLSPDYRAELSKLQDAAPAVPGEVVKDVVERELHAPADKAFAAFEAVPLACASIGQVHPATLHDGTDVVVKVRRPNVVEDMEQDFEIMQNFAGDQWVQIRACFRTSQHPESSRLNALAA
jgi:ubiquinone biosynthesis protein